ncbi:MAG: HEAT repeat domain-containing protein [Planctomycetota bacterium]
MTLRSLRARLLLVVPCLLALSSLALAAPQGDSPLFGPPPKRPTEEPEKPKDPDAPQGKYGDEIARFSSFPQAAGYEIGRRLALVGREVVPELLSALGHRDWRIRAGAAFTLGEMREASALPRLRESLDEVGNRIALDTYFVALVRIDPIAGTDAVLPHLLSPSGRIAKQAFDALPRRLDARFADRLRDLLETGSDQVRERAMDLYTRLETPLDLDLLFSRLGDREPSVARRAADELATVDDSAAIDRLRSILRDGTLRAASYALIALTVGEDRTNQSRLPESGPGLDRMLAMFRVRGDLENAAAAIALANLSLRSDDARVRELADGPLVFRLIDSSVGGRIFRDYRSVGSLCLEKASLITGRDFGRDGDAWKRWWVENGKTFRARRELGSVPADRVAAMALSARRRRAGGDDLTVRLVGEAVPDEMLDRGRTLLLDGPRIGALREALVEHGFFAARGVRDDPDWTGDLAEIEVELDGSRYRRLHRGEIPADLGPIFSTIEGLLDAERWQFFRDPSSDPDRRAWTEATRRELAGLTDEARAERLTAMALKAYADGDARTRHEAILQLRAVPPARREAHRAELLALLGAKQVEIPGAEELVALLGELPGEDVDAAVLAFLPLYSDAGIDAAEAFLAARPLETSLALARADDRERRGAGVRGLASRLDDSRARDAAVAALGDPDARVRREMLAPLERDPALATKIVPRLLESYDAGEEDLRRRLATSIGRLGGAGAISALSSRLEGASAPLRRALFQGIAATGRDEAADALIGALGSSPDEATRLAALDAIGSLSPETRRRAFSALLAREDTGFAPRQLIREAPRVLGDLTAEGLEPFLAGEDEALAREAAFVLADRLVGRAVPVLAKSLLDRGQEAPAREALELLTCVAATPASPEDAFREYTEWWEEAKARDPDRWFVEALSRRRYSAVDFGPYLTGERDDPRVLALLLTVLRDRDWYLRVRANRYLATIRGSGFGVVEKSSSEEELDRIRRLWTAWYRDYVLEGR